MIVSPTGELGAWTIFARPDDAPDFFVARLFYLDKSTEHAFFGATLEEARTFITTHYPGLTCLMRSDVDHPSVVETWL
jgi:hypothetical protein